MTDDPSDRSCGTGSGRETDGGSAARRFIPTLQGSRPPSHFYGALRGPPQKGSAETLARPQGKASPLNDAFAFASSVQATCKAVFPQNHVSGAEGVEIENLGLCRAEVDRARATYPLYEYDTVIINLMSYTHFLFGQDGEFSNELYELGKLCHE